MTLVPKIKALQDDLQHTKATTSENFNENNLKLTELNIIKVLKRFL